MTMMVIWAVVVMDVVRSRRLIVMRRRVDMRMMRVVKIVMGSMVGSVMWSLMMEVVGELVWVMGKVMRNVLRMMGVVRWWFFLVLLVLCLEVQRICAQNSHN
jgi:hypothetical protein